MNRIFRALALSCLAVVGPPGCGVLVGGPAWSAPFASYPAALKPDDTTLGLVWQGGPTVATASNTWMRANLGVAKVRTLESFAVTLGVTLGSADDGAVIALANDAISKAAGTGGLVVEMPAGMVINSSVGLQIYNNGGWTCPQPGACTWRAVRSDSDPTVTWAASLGDPDATNIVLANIKFDGGWNGDWLGTGSKAAWLGKQGGVQLLQDYNGPADAAYHGKSTLRLQEPGSYVEGLYIANFAGDCMDTAGAGGITFHNIRGEGCGHYGLFIDTYDSKWSDIDFGAVGWTAIVCDHQGCANNQFSGIKGWYGGQGRNPAHNHDLEDYGNSNTWTGLNLQDSAGDNLWEDNDFNENFIGSIQWGGCIPWMDGQVAAIRSGGGFNNHHKLNVSIQQGSYSCQAGVYPNITAIVKDETSASNLFNLAYTTYDTFDLLAFGFPNNNYGFVDAWVAGPLDTTNSLSVNGAARVPRSWVCDPALGDLAFGARSDGSLIGLDVSCPGGQYPGNVSLVAQGGYAQVGAYVDSSVAASGALTSTQNYADGETVTLGAPSPGVTKTYTFAATLASDANGNQLPNQVHIGATEAQSLANLTNAINAGRPAVFKGTISGTTLTLSLIGRGAPKVGDTVTGSAQANSTVAAGTVITGACTTTTSATTCPVSISQTVTGPTGAFGANLQSSSGVIGVDYSYGTIASPYVSAANDGAHVLTVTALARGSAGNADLTSKVAAHASWGGSTLSGGSDGAQSYVFPLRMDAKGAFLHPLVPGPYVDDATAAAAGVPLAGEYLDAQSVLHIRQGIVATAAVSCAAGAPSNSFQVVGGVVTHC